MEVEREVEELVELWEVDVLIVVEVDEEVELVLVLVD